MRKLKGILILILLLALLASPIAVLASDLSGAQYYGTIIVSNNGTATTNVAVNCTISTQALIDGGYLNSSANNCVVRSSSGAELPFMPSVNASYPWCVWVPSIGQDAHLSDILYTANSTGGEIRYFPGDNMTTVDSGTLELSANFTVEQKGWVDTDNATAKNLVYKEGAFRTYVSPLFSGNITSQVADSIGGLIPGSGVALDFVRANSDWVSIPDHANFDFTDGAGNDEPATLIVWVNLDDATDGHFIAKNTGANVYTWRFRTSGELLEFACFKNDATKYIGRRSPAVTGYEGLWTHFAASYNASETSAGINLYINGVDVDNADFELLAYTGMSNTASVVELGANEAGTAQFLDGIMAEAKIYTAELTPAEILADYNGIHRSANLEAWYRIDEGTGNPTDISGNGHNATANLADWIAATSVTATGVPSGDYPVTTRQTVNLLTNGDFEDGGTPPDDWTLTAAGGEASDTDTATKRINASSANVTRGGNDCNLYQDLADFASYQEVKVTFGAWVYATVADRVRISIDDGVLPASSSGYHTGDSQWRWLTITHKLDSGATQLRIELEVITGDTTGYFDAAVLVAGSDFEDFEGNMLSNWSFELGDPPDDWAGAGFSQSSSQVKIGAESVERVNPGGAEVFRYSVPEFALYANEIVTLGMWIWCDVANEVQVQLKDGITATYSSFHSGGSDWEWLVATATMGAGLTDVRAGCFVASGGVFIAYWDGAVMVHGTTTELDVTKRIEHLQILVDNVWQDSAGAATVPDSSANWTFLQNNVMPYMEYQYIYLGPNLRQHIVWEYDDTTFTDLSGSGHDATPTFRTGTSDPDVSAVFASFLPIEEAQAPAYALEDAPAFVEIDTGNVTSAWTTTPPAGAFPLAGVITAMANATGTPSQLPLLIIAVFIILACSLTVSATMRRYGSGSLIIKIIAITAVMGIFIALGDFGIDFWMLVVFLIIATSLAMGSKQVGWQ